MSMPPKPDGEAYHDRIRVITVRMSQDEYGRLHDAVAARNEGVADDDRVSMNRLCLNGIMREAKEILETKHEADCHALRRELGAADAPDLPPYRGRSGGSAA